MSLYKHTGIEKQVFPYEKLLLTGWRPCIPRTSLLRSMGSGMGNLKIPYSVWEKIKES